MADYTISFKSLRAGTVYTVNIGSGNGNVALKGAAQPFVTQEDDSEDMFQPVRTQSGYLRIVDDGDGSFNWKNLVPMTAFGMPVTLTTGNTVVWQGYIQTQTFSGDLYGNPQEREYPVICPLSVLDAEKPSTSERNTRSFAYLLWTILNAAQTTGVVEFANIYFQGGADARTWLQTKIDWKNFHSTDSNGVVSAKYSLYQILEDVCTFWGWTCRTHGKDVYFTCSDDSTEQNYLQVTLAQLQNLGGSTGTIINRSNIQIVSLSGDIFASTDNEDYVMNGPSRAVVTADVNQQKTVMQFAPKEYENQMDAVPPGYTWQQGEQDLTGFFTTPIVNSLPTSGLTTAEIVARSSVSGSGFCRRQIFESTESTDAEKVDAIVLAQKCTMIDGVLNISHQIEIDTVYPMDYTGGSFKFTGSLFVGCKRYTGGNELHMRLGIGENRQNAKWWYMNPIPTNGDISCGWSTTVRDFIARLEGGNIISTAAYHINPADILTYVEFKSSTIPAPTQQEGGGYGKLFIDIIGCGVENFTIGDFSVEFSREVTDIPLNIHAVRPRVMSSSRDTSHEYKAENWNQSKDEWNADCIFASDNNLEYGYGLLLNANGGYVSTVPYSGNSEHPEQHLANRVSNYWRNSKRKMMVDLRYNLVSSIRPYNFVSMDGPTFYPASISHDWRDDKVQIGLMELST